MGTARRSRVGERSEITVVLAVGGSRRSELSAALTATTLVVADEAGRERALLTASDLIPDVVLLDEEDGREGTGPACLESMLRTPATRLVALVVADDELAYETLLQGAFSTVLTTAPTDEVVAAVRAAARGESTVVVGSAERLLSDARRVTRAGADPYLPSLRLTDTEQEVLARRAEGRTPAEIAAMHDVTARLVNLHMGYAVAKVHHHLQRVRARDAVSARTER
jgi:NarL family two-component system response regulator LiaR